jgi:uncharacterized protein with HEPN domain
MPERDWRLRIYDITDVIEKIQKYTNGMSFSEFYADDRTIDAVLRNLEVIGEAARHVPAHVIERHKDIPWDKMRALRNIVAHEYFGVQLPIVWETIERRLPLLKAAMRRLLNGA